jgi:hypothetical protein
MTDAAIEIRCSKPGCAVTSTSLCSEGHDPVRSCPFYGQVVTETLNVDDQFDETTNEVDDEVEEDRIELSSGEPRSC